LIFMNALPHFPMLEYLKLRLSFNQSKQH
jgi:hypothetical protein